jgi:hypothetical protein
MVCLDFFLVNSKWTDTYSNSFIHSFSHNLSDHSPIVLTFGIASVFQKSSFKFDKSWVEYEGFSKIVNECWVFTIGF